MRTATLQSEPSKSGVVMPRKVRVELSTFDWIRMTDTQLRDRGHPGSRRVCYTGHRTFLPRQYVESIGK